MEETLSFYRPFESPSFRLVLNAIHELTAGARHSGRTPVPNEHLKEEHVASQTIAMEQALERATDSLELPQGNGHGDLVRGVAENLRRRIAPAVARLRELFGQLALEDEETQMILAGWLHLAKAAIQDLSTGREEGRLLPQRLMELELAISLCEAWGRLISAEIALGSVEDYYDVD